MSTASKLVGTVLAGRYRIEKQLGEGGMGAVFEATQLSLTRKVAIKVVKPAFENDEERLKRFEVETEAIARMSHPHIVSVVDAGREGELLFLAMELLDGVTVRQALRGGPLGWRRALTVAEGVASALVAAHEAGVIHRDLKAENVVLWEKAGSPDFAKVLDFGVAKLTSQAQAPVVTGTGFVAGTPGCIAPEQILGKKDDARSDLYSLGVLLFEMLTGRAPFVADSTMELMLKHLNEPAPKPSSAATGSAAREIPAAVDALTVGLLQKDPALRPASAKALVAAIRALKESSPHNAVPTGVGPDAQMVGSRLVAIPSAADSDASLPTLSHVATPTPLSSSATANTSSVGPGATGHTPMTSPVTLAPSFGGSAPPEPPARRSDDEIAAEAVSNFKRTWKKRGKRRGLIAASLVLTLFVACGVSQSWRHHRALSLSHDDEAAAHLHKAVDAMWDLDLDRVYDEADLAQRADADSAWPHLLRSVALAVDNSTFPRINMEVTEARRLAELDAHRNRMIWKADHALDYTGLLWAPVLKDPVGAMKDHGRYGCSEGVEPLLVALRQLMFTEDPAVLEAVFGMLDREPMRPALALGLSRAARKRAATAPDDATKAKELGTARALLEEQRKHSKSRLLVDELVDIELESGNRAAALALLEAQSTADRNDLRAQLRLAYLRARGANGDWTAFDTYVRTLDTLPKGDARRVDGLERAATAAATLGAMERANQLWDTAFAEADAAEPEVSGQLASLAVFFAVMQEDVPSALKWLQRAKESTFRMEDPITKQLNTFFALAATTLLSPNPSERDVRVLEREATDVPIVVPMVKIMSAQLTGRWDDALALSAQLPPCMTATKGGTLPWHHAQALLAAGDRAGADAQLAIAVATLEKALTSESEQRCTRGADIGGLLQSLSYTTALARLADAALRTDRPDVARQALARSRALWSPDAALVTARQLHAVEAWLAGGPREPAPYREPGRATTAPSRP